MSADEVWSVRRSLLLLDQLESRRYRSRRARIEARIDELLKEPLLAARSERLRHEFAGLRSARVADATRLIYRVCQECRQLGEQERLPLDCCLSSATVDRTVNLLCLMGPEQSPEVIWQTGPGPCWPVSSRLSRGF